LLEICSCHKSF